MVGMERRNEPAHGPPPDAIDQNVEAIVALQSEETRALTRHQRAIERMLRILTVPAFLYGVAIAMALWIGANVGVLLTGREPWDRPPFVWLDTGLTMLSLLMTATIVITQSRQGRTAERNAHLDLQVSLLVDQKVAKIIGLLEEMRADLPALRDRRDHEAEAMQVAVDPGRVAAILVEKMANAETEWLRSDDAAVG